MATAALSSELLSALPQLCASTPSSRAPANLAITCVSSASSSSTLPFSYSALAFRNPQSAIVADRGRTFVALASGTGGGSVQRSESEWRTILSPEQFRILRQKGTEWAGTGEYNKFYEEGLYECAGCGTPLYKSTTKFNSGCGWPAFYEGLPGAIDETIDADGQRIEITCSACGGHLGHVFKGEGFPTPTDARHCVNSISLKFTPGKSTTVETSGSGKTSTSTSATTARVFVSESMLSRRHLKLGWSLSSLSASGGISQQQGKNSARPCRSTHIARASAEVKKGTADTRPTAGVSIYQPASYDVLVADAAKAVVYALDDGKLRLEVDFPPLPSSVSGYKGSSDEFIDANIQLAFTLARKLNELRGLSTKIVFPDGPERRRALRVFRSALELTNCISFGGLDDLPADIRGAARDLLGQIKGFFDFDFEEDSAGKDTATPDIFIVIGATTNELPNVKEYADYFANNSPVILFNLETDTLRSDLGLFGFPPKDIHYKFLSQFQPVFYIRTRDYSKSIPVAPFILNYSGALLRQYPGPWQVMLKQVDGSYACVAESLQRFTLFQTKEELLTSLGLQEEAGSTMAFLRSGYKTSTWWEDDLELEESSAWRT